MVYFYQLLKRQRVQHIWGYEGRRKLHWFNPSLHFLSLVLRINAREEFVLLGYLHSGVMALMNMIQLLSYLQNVYSEVDWDVDLGGILIEPIFLSFPPPQLLVFLGPLPHCIYPTDIQVWVVEMGRIAFFHSTTQS